MKRVIFLILIAVSVFAAQRYKAEFTHPAATGLNSTFDVDALRPTDARLLTNADLSSKPGALRPRFGLRSYGSVLDSAYSVAPYYNAEYSDKILFGVRAQASMTIAKPRALSDSASPGNWSFVPSQIRRIAASDDRRTNLTDTLFGWLYPSDRYDWLKVQDQLLLADGQAVPSVIRSRNITPQLGSGDQGYSDPRFRFGRNRISFGLEAPGQLRVSLTNKAGTQDGPYQYRMRYVGFSGDSLGAPGIASASVFPNSQAVAITFFESRPFRFKGSATADSSVVDSSRTAHGWQIIQLERRKANEEWFVRDKFPMYSKDTLVYIDTVGDTLTRLADTFDIAISVPTPGAWYECALADTLRPADGKASQLASDNLENDDYWVAYSYYDPISGMESALGPKTRVNDPLRIIGADSLLKIVVKGRTRITDRAQYIRFYRSVANDSTVLYAMFDLSANDPSMLGVQSAYYSFGIPVGWGTDVALTTGLFPNCCGTWYGGTDFTGSTGDTTIIVLSETGDPIARPPFISGCEIPFSDLEWFANRVWGIGDPEFKQRLYYGESDNIGDVPAVNYLALDEDDNDELVGLIASDADVLYAFKHNKIFAVTGYDPEYDLQFHVISSRHGIANANCLTWVSPFVYFLAPDFSLYRLSGGTLDTVSTMVDSTIEAMFVTQQSLYDNARLLHFNDRLYLTNDSSGSTLAYDYNNSVWSRFTTASTYRLLSAFAYDTLTVQRGFGGFDDWMLWSPPNYIVREVRNTHPFYSTDYIGGITTQHTIEYQTPYIGDGESVYEITEARLSIESPYSTYCIVTLYNQYNDSLMSVTTSIGPSQTNYRIGFGPHIGRYLAARIVVPSPNGLLQLHDVTLYYRSVGDETVR